MVCTLSIYNSFSFKLFSRNEITATFFYNSLLPYVMALNTFLVANDPHGPNRPCLDECLRIPQSLQTSNIHQGCWSAIAVSCIWNCNHTIAKNPIRNLWTTLRCSNFDPHCVLLGCPGFLFIFVSFATPPVHDFSKLPSSLDFGSFLYLFVSRLASNHKNSPMVRAESRGIHCIWYWHLSFFGLYRCSWGH